MLKIFRRSRGSNDRFEGINLGDEVRDTLTGFQGIAVSMNQCISGCDQIAIQPEMRDGTWRESIWFDVERVELVTAGRVKISERRTGADTVPPSRHTKPNH